MNDKIHDVRRKLTELTNSHTNKVYVGWKPPHVERKEGDVWEENDSMWTIKNGIRQNITKLDDAKTPWWCPKCNKSMNHRFDIKMWRLRNKCFDCVTAEETELKRLGKWEEYQKKIMTANFIAAAKDKIMELEDMRDSISTPEIIHADDEKILMIEKWEVDIPKLRADLQEEIDKIKAALAEFEASV